jgi:hypothetical protein
MELLQAAKPSLQKKLMMAHARVETTKAPLPPDTSMMRSPVEEQFPVHPFFSAADFSRTSCG